jgi:ribosomal-protein-serine acetyltransferase
MTDVGGYFHFVNGNASRIARYFPTSTRRNKDIPTFALFVSITIRRREEMEFDRFMIRDIRSQAIVGDVCLKAFGWNALKCHPSFFIDAHHEGRGIMTKFLSFLVE